MAVGTPGQNGGRIIMRTGVFTMPNLHLTPNPGAAALMIPAEANRINIALTTSGLTFLAESAAALAAFGTTGAFATSAATIPFLIITTEAIYAAGYDATDGAPFVIRYIAHYWAP